MKTVKGPRMFTCLNLKILTPRGQLESCFTPLQHREFSVELEFITESLNVSHRGILWAETF